MKNDYSLEYESYIHENARIFTVEKKDDIQTLHIDNFKPNSGYIRGDRKHSFENVNPKDVISFLPPTRTGQRILKSLKSEENILIHTFKINYSYEDLKGLLKVLYFAIAIFSIIGYFLFSNGLLLIENENTIDHLSNKGSYLFFVKFALQITVMMILAFAVYLIPLGVACYYIEVKYLTPIINIFFKFIGGVSMIVLFIFVPYVISYYEYTYLEPIIPIGFAMLFVALIYFLSKKIITRNI